MPAEKIQFFSEDIDFLYKGKSKARNWINTVISKEDKRLVGLNIIFCSDKYLLDINREYLNHDTYTDIVTFHYSEDPSLIEGDLYISIDRIRENAASINSTFEQELNRVIIHGVLHLAGYKDKSREDVSVMRRKEEESLALLNQT